MKPGKYERAVWVAADSVERLRACDVFRVLEERPRGVGLDGLAEWIVSRRPDLVDEVQGCLSELRAAAD